MSSAELVELDFCNSAPNLTLGRGQTDNKPDISIKIIIVWQRVGTPFTMIPLGFSTHCPNAMSPKWKPWKGLVQASGDSL